MYNTSGFNIPGIGPNYGMPQQQPNAQPASSEPASFMELINPASRGGEQSGQTSSADKQAAEQVLKLFGQMLNTPAAPTQAAASASAASGSTSSAPANAPAAAWEKLFEKFDVSYAEPDFISDPAKLTGFFGQTLNTIDFAQGLQSDDPNTFMRNAFNTLMVRATQAAYLASKESTQGAIPAALREYAQRTYKQDQMGAASKSQAVPESMGFLAQAVAEKFTSANPNATPDQVVKAVELVMQNMQKAFAPNASTTAQSPQMNWADFLN